MTGAQDSCWSWCCACVRSGQAGLSSALLTPHTRTTTLQRTAHFTGTPVLPAELPAGGTADMRLRLTAGVYGLIETEPLPYAPSARTVKYPRPSFSRDGSGHDGPPPPLRGLLAPERTERRRGSSSGLVKRVRQTGSSKTGSAHAAGRQGVRSARNQAVGTSLTRSPNSSDIISARICASRSSCSLRFWARIRSTVMSRFSMFSSNSLTSR